MNDRIKDLADQASENIRYRIDPHTFKHIDDPNGPYIRVEFNKEKFAELIVAECVKVAMRSVSDDEPKEAWYLIQEHFGVE